MPGCSGGGPGTVREWFKTAPGRAQSGGDWRWGPAQAAPPLGNIGALRPSWSHCNTPVFTTQGEFSAVLGATV